LAVLAGPADFARQRHGARVERGVHPQTREQLGALAQAGPQWPEQPVVAEPTVGHHQHRNLGKDRAQARDQHHRLRELVGEHQRLAAQAQATGAQCLAAQVEPEGQRHTAPAPVDLREQPYRDDRLRPRPACLVGLRRMIEGALTGEDVLACFRVDRIVER